MACFCLFFYIFLFSGECFFVNFLYFPISFASEWFFVNFYTFLLHLQENVRVCLVGSARAVRKSARQVTGAPIVKNAASV